MDDTIEDDDAAAMAQAMGFSSFGGKPHANKKRRYNSHTDAAISSTPSATGSNATALGVVRGSGHPNANAEEIDLDDGTENHGAGGVGEEEEEEEEEEEGSKGISSSLLRSAPHGSLPARPPPTVSHTSHDNSLAARHPPDGNITHHHSKKHIHNTQSSAPGKPWYEGYYDPSSNQNPWETLERQMGLSTQGIGMAQATESTEAP